jgi:hypothetical protein
VATVGAKQGLEPGANQGSDVYTANVAVNPDIPANSVAGRLFARFLAVEREEAPPSRTFAQQAI